MTNINVNIVIKISFIIFNIVDINFQKKKKL